MTEEGSVWDTGPQYPEMWPEQAEGTSAHDVPQDDTPQTGSPVDLDTPLPEPAPVVPVVTPAKKDASPPPLWQRAVLGFPVWILFGFLAVVAVVFFVIVRSGDPGTTSADRVQSTNAPTTVPSQVIPATTVAAPTTSVAATIPPPTEAPPIFTLPDTPVVVPPVTEPPTATTPPTTPATEPPATAPPTAPPATAPTATTPPVTAAPAVTPTPPPATTLPANGPVVTIIGKVAPCDYGAQCLLAGFALHNFKTQPSEFVCEFADGSRYSFHFTRQQVERACATGNTNGSITIEVDGVRSATFTRP